MNTTNVSFKNALVSCSDKKNLASFLAPLQAKGMRIVSTGGTAKHLREQGLTVVDVSEQTGFEEVMDGRVKTLHPKVHMALLARQDMREDQEVLNRFEIEPFDLVIGNLYPFESEPSIDTIDIGGPSFLRAAAKNFERIAVICDPADYEWVAQRGVLTLAERQLLAAKVFSHTSTYDSMIAKHFAKDDLLAFRDLSLGGKYLSSLRYGENSQQKASWFRVSGSQGGLHEAKVIQGKELSYNNLLDLDSAVSTAREFKSDFVCVAVKHNNPCGVAIDKNAHMALTKAIAADSQSVFGGIIAANFSISGEMASQLSEVFLECIVAPKFEPEALVVFSKKKNVRLLEWANMMASNSDYLYRTISGGFLVQSQDHVEDKWDSNWTVIGEKLGEKEKSDLLLALKVCAHLKSNAIAIALNGQTVGLGMGQVNRVDAVEQAILRMQKHHPGAQGAVLASDAFFPFADSIERIAKAGIRYVIQPGGSMRDDEVKSKAKDLGITMVLTGKRHFLH